MRKYLIVVVFFVQMLGGCSNEIDRVKAQSFPLDDTYTIAQIFDNRKYCESMDWSSFEDEKGRIIVESKCEIKGVEKFYDDWLANKLELEQKNYDDIDFDVIISRSPSMQQNVKDLEGAKGGVEDAIWNLSRLRPPTPEDIKDHLSVYWRFKSQQDHYEKKLQVYSESIEREKLYWKEYIQKKINSRDNVRKQNEAHIRELYATKPNRVFSVYQWTVKNDSYSTFLHFSLDFEYLGKDSQKVSFYNNSEDYPFELAAANFENYTELKSGIENYMRFPELH